MLEPIEAINSIVNIAAKYEGHLGTSDEGERVLYEFKKNQKKQKKKLKKKQLRKQNNYG